ncbi:type III secretion system protein [Erwinia piriflorinigrans CFBP 5888]|uniref:Type III secretion system protein n=2 Tax=Erwinia piriflorinigrans TaxID=665097 RepID=V5Z5H5_9GAMM|nr:type III secretion system protein [Erwinia piriflorinigrans CFBP 5888]
MLERSQEMLQGNIARTESQLTQVKAQILQLQQENASINQQIKLLTPSGVLGRDDIYKGIRKQGALLTHLQIVIQKITQFEEERFTYEQELNTLRTTKKNLDKRHCKLTFYLQQLRRDRLLRRENNAENEIQEIVSYGKRNF